MADDALSKDSRSEVRACAEKLAKAHLDIDPDTERIFWVPAPDLIRLIEITPNVHATHDVIAVGFQPDKEDGIDFPSVLILLHPEELRAIEEGRLRMPPGWEWEKRELVYPQSQAS